jgi:hypothetical protein
MVEIVVVSAISRVAEFCKNERYKGMEGELLATCGGVEQSRYRVSFRTFFPY